MGGVSQVRLVGVRTERQREARYFRALKAIVRVVAFIVSEFGSYWKVSRGKPWLQIF